MTGAAFFFGGNYRNVRGMKGAVRKNEQGVQGDYRSPCE